MTFTCPSTTSIRVSQFDDVYSGEIKLLSDSVPTSDREASGLLKSSVLSAKIASLLSSGILPDPKTSTSAVYSTKAKAVLESAKAEYCFYYSRYHASLTYLFAGIKNAASNQSAELQEVVQRRLASAQTLNRKVNDLIQYMNAITERMLSSSTTLQSEIEKINASLREKRDALEKQNRIIQSNEATMRLQKEMVTYSEEKARYSDNLLKLYSFLNIVALGLLVYVYKAAGEE